MMRKRYGLVAAAVAALITGCTSSPTGPTYDPDIPLSWAPAITNRFFPIVPGTTYEFRGVTPDGTETVVVEVLATTRLIQGVTASIVRDRVYLNGSLIEDTYDWYAQDSSGNVWYLGEDSKEVQNGVVVSTDGSWEWGVDGALPGIVMWANPAAHVGEEYRQEFYEDEAEDFATVLAVNESVVVPFGSFTGCVKTQDRNALEPGPLEHKFYCPTMGFALELKVGSTERLELIRVTAP